MVRQSIKYILLEMLFVHGNKYFAAMHVQAVKVCVCAAAVHAHLPGARRSTGRLLPLDACMHSKEATMMTYAR